MHDGAVIIREDRIAAAACFLPLTVRPSLDRDLGSRHRAAIGVTEETDALAIVVSEERGEVSLSLRGRLERALAVEDLRARLRELILQKQRGRDEAVAGAEVDA
jgi:diadenylate cyclase